MVVEGILAEWIDRCRQLARLAREDVQRAAAYDVTTDPDATVRLRHPDVEATTKN